jgi:hypothetical protein
MPPLPSPTKCPLCQAPSPSALRSVLKRLLAIAEPARWDESPVAQALSREVRQLLEAAGQEEER